MEWCYGKGWVGSNGSSGTKRGRFSSTEENSFETVNNSISLEEDIKLLDSSEGLIQLLLKIITKTSKSGNYSRLCLEINSHLELLHSLKKRLQKRKHVKPETDRTLEISQLQSKLDNFEKSKVEEIEKLKEDFKQESQFQLGVLRSEFDKMEKDKSEEKKLRETFQKKLEYWQDKAQTLQNKVTQQANKNFQKKKDLEALETSKALISEDFEALKELHLDLEASKDQLENEKLELEKILKHTQMKLRQLEKEVTEVLLSQIEDGLKIEVRRLKGEVNWLQAQIRNKDEVLGGLKKSRDEALQGQQIAKQHSKEIEVQFEKIMEEWRTTQNQTPANKPKMLTSTPKNSFSDSSPGNKHIKKPINAFMIWAKNERKKIMGRGDASHIKDASRILGPRWKAMSASEKQPYFEEQFRLQKVHREMYPDYKFCPKSRKSSSASSLNKKKQMSKGKGLKKQRRAHPQIDRVMAFPTSPNFSIIPMTSAQP